MGRDYDQLTTRQIAAIDAMIRPQVAERCKEVQSRWTPDDEALRRTGLEKGARKDVEAGRSLIPFCQLPDP